MNEASLVLRTGIEPVRPFRARDFKSLLSTNSNTRAIHCKGKTNFVDSHKIFIPFNHSTLLLWMKN